MNLINKEWLLFSGVLLLTLAGAVGILRWLAPQLIGLPTDLRLVQVSEKLPPFYEGVFRRSDYLSADFLLNDPVTVIRGRPGFPELRSRGPHDVLGFRNREVPVYADVVVIGDSQTYGSGLVLEDNWPSLLAARLKTSQAGVYNMATGGWGGAQYLEMATKAAAFQPQLIIVAFYSGNDSLDSFRVAYGMDRFADLRPRAGLDAGDAPAAEFPPPPESLWPVVFDDGVQAVFTPELRLVANDSRPAVEAGYAVMAKAAREIQQVTQPFDAGVIFTIIPTKEYVYAEKVRRAGLEPPPGYTRLVEAEGERIGTLAGALRAISGATYVDLTAPLSAAALDGVMLYQTSGNGHPVAAATPLSPTRWRQRPGTG